VGRWEGGEGGEGGEKSDKWPEKNVSYENIQNPKNFPPLPTSPPLPFSIKMNLKIKILYIINERFHRFLFSM